MKKRAIILFVFFAVWFVPAYVLTYFDKTGGVSGMWLFFGWLPAAGSAWYLGCA